MAIGKMSPESLNLEYRLAIVGFIETEISQQSHRTMAPLTAYPTTVALRKDNPFRSFEKPQHFPRYPTFQPTQQ